MGYFDETPADEYDDEFDPYGDEEYNDEVDDDRDAESASVDIDENTEDTGVEE